MTLITHDCDVNLVTGEVTQANRDLFFAGHPPLSMVRRYSSLSTERGPLGYGWQHDLVLKLSEQGGQFFFGGVGEGDDVFAFDAQSRVWHDESASTLSTLTRVPSSSTIRSYPLGGSPNRRPPSGCTN